jgi:hypothetical protein
MNRRELVVAAAAVLACATFVTWPQAAHLTTHAAAHDDSMFSMWRLAWIAEALKSHPTRLFDGNTFYPARRTLAFSDATLLEGIIAAPFLWLGVPLVTVYNVLLLLGFAASGLAMFVLARYLVGSVVPALVGAACFTLAPYRVEHFMHLELQWAMWMPLGLWALHRAVADGSARHGMLCGLFLGLQTLSCVYYGVFFAMALTAFAPLLLVQEPRFAPRALAALGAGAAIAAVIIVPYALPYIEVARTFGQRPVEEIVQYSARPLDYALSPPTSWLWGWTAAASGPERKLSFGTVATMLALAGLAFRPRRLAVAYAALALFCMELSFGLNGIVFPWLSKAVPGLDGLRALARFGLLAACAVAVLAAFGSQLVLKGFTGSPRYAALAATLFALLALDYAQRGMRLMPIAAIPPSGYTVYKAIRTLGTAPVLELPRPPLNQLPGREAFYTFWSIGSWHPLVNGYSGYFPPEYIQTAVRTEHLPDDRSFDYLRRLGVRYLIVHRDFYALDDYTELMTGLRRRDDVRHYGTYPAPSGAAELFVIER